MNTLRQGSTLPSSENRAPSIIRRFDQAERVLAFDQGKLEVITVGGIAIGKGSYAPGWRWSRCITPAASRLAKIDPPDLVGVVLSGRAKVLVNEETEIDLMAGDFFHIAGDFDEWVVGYRRCEILYLSGVDALIRQVHRA